MSDVLTVSGVRNNSITSPSPLPKAGLGKISCSFQLPFSTCPHLLLPFLPQTPSVRSFSQPASNSAQNFAVSAVSSITHTQFERVSGSSNQPMNHSGVWVTKQEGKIHSADPTAPHLHKNHLFSAPQS